MTQPIFYQLSLTPEQLEYLADYRYKQKRMAYFTNLVMSAALKPYPSLVSGCNKIIRVGQVEKSRVQLAEEWGCDRKSVAKVLDEMERIGLVTSEKSPLTSIHSIHAVLYWTMGNVRIFNEQYKAGFDYRASYRGALDNVPGISEFYEAMNASRDIAKKDFRKVHGKKSTDTILLLPTVECLRKFYDAKWQTDESSQAALENQPPVTTNSEHPLPSDVSTSYNDNEAHVPTLHDGDATTQTETTGSAETSHGSDTAAITDNEDHANTAMQR